MFLPDLCNLFNETRVLVEAITRNGKDESVNVMSHSCSDRGKRNLLFSDG
jgi:hypothetical protein